ncbi:MAG: hypothetical protein E6J62_04045 [Deltaproteobacteria bacterium]|nr:MAG: hypothetical protein E6J62_04045 [Deltaproteobacteria bacterium]
MTEARRDRVDELIEERRPVPKGDAEMPECPGPRTAPLDEPAGRAARRARELRIVRACLPGFDCFSPRSVAVEIDRERASAACAGQLDPIATRVEHSPAGFDDDTIDSFTRCVLGANRAGEPRTGKEGHAFGWSANVGADDSFVEEPEPHGLAEALCLARAGLDIDDGLPVIAQENLSSRVPVASRGFIVTAPRRS